MVEYILVSAFVTNKNKLEELQSQWSKRNRRHNKCYGRTKDQSLKISISEFGGSVFLLDSDNLDKGFIDHIPCPLATGITLSSEGDLLVGSFNHIKILIYF